MNKSNHYMLLALLFGAIFTHNAQALVINTTVAGTDNLYFSDWGHSYTSTQPEWNDSGAWNNNFDIETSALGRGNAASAVNYAFSSGQSLSISATGSVTDWGTSYTDPNGTTTSGANEGWNFRGLPVYSLIGLWSTSATLIDPVDSPFYIGSSLDLFAPTAAGSLYLFLGENDGYFNDNFFDDKYNVSITVANVPEPSTVALMALGMFGIMLARRRKQI